MSSILQRLLKLFAGALLLLVGTQPLRAQLDPKLQATTSDFLDLYQGVTTAGVLKPEILLLMDFSTSTNRIMFHPLFPNNWDDEERFDDNSRYYSIYITIALNGSTNHYEISKVGFGRGAYAASFNISGTSFTIGGNHDTYNGVATNTLIKPDGTEVTLADVQATVADANIYRSGVGAANLEKYALNWVRCASHVRMQCVVGGATRNIDFPLNWAVLDSSSTGKPLSTVKALNPIAKGGDGAYYDIDTSYQGTANGASYDPMRESGNQYTAEIGSSVDNVRLYRSRYIQWVFSGKDASGAYYVPDAITSMTSLNPATLTYVPSTASYTYSTANITATAFNNGLPNHSRNQAIKEAFLRTWFNNQDGVNFAYRTLHDSGSTSTGGITTPWSMDTNRWTVLASGTATTWTAITGQEPNSGEGTPLVPAQFDSYAQLTTSSAFAAQEASLTKAQLDCMQHFLIMLTDGSPTVNVPNEGASSFPYISSTGAQSVYTGNTTVKNNLNRFVQADWYWNNATMAAIVAHGGQRSSGTATDWIRDPSSITYPQTTPQTWAPIWVQKRKFGGTGGTDYTLAKPHPIQTMTVGVSLGNHYNTGTGSAWPVGTMPDASAVPVALQTDPTGSKYRLLMTAMCGDPATTSLKASSIKPFYRNAIGNKASDAAYFFDGRDPSTLVANLQDAFDEIKNMSAINTSTTPVIPFVGMGLSQQLYISRFIPSAVSTTPIWTGDLSMFSTRQTGTNLDILDKNGNTVTDLSGAIPNWSADDALRNNRLWSARKVWTRLPNATSLVRFTPFNDGTGGAPTNAYNTIKASLATTLTTDALKQQLISWNLGANIHDASYSSPSAPNAAAPNRPLPDGQTTPPGDILGDIIDSTPAVVEYTLTQWVRSQLSSYYPKLYAQVTAAEALTPKAATPHFRVIFVGTNRGFFHAFGEVAYTQTTVSGTTTTSIVHGDVDELWAFMPTDFLDNLDDIGPSSTLRHRYGVDGDPAVWFTDVPDSTSNVGNGKIDYKDTAPATGEKAMVVFGLKKGGRSYYGLNIQNPFTPSLGWSLVPDESASLTSAVLDSDCANGTDAAALTTVKNIVSKMGFSSCIPAFGRVLQGTSTKIREVVFLGGGYSTPEVEAKYTGTPALGRSALALDVRTGKVLAAWDMSSISGMGPVASGLVPFQFFLNSGYVQRAYFTDYKGGLWALGSTKTNDNTSTYVNFRRDTNYMDQWTVDGARGSALAVRHVYQDIDFSWRSASGANNSIFSMRPAPFLVGNYPGVATWTSPVTGSSVSLNPATVGIAMESGDRDNPLDKNFTTTTRPARHRLTVVFDRQDSARSGIGLTGGLITNSNLSNFTAQTTAPASNYLNDNASSTKFGYYLNFPDTYTGSDGNLYTPKGIYEPIVIGGVLFYSYFTPNLSTCSGGAGNTYTNRICDVMFPAWPGNGVAAATTAGACNSGQVASWIGVSSPLGVMSTAIAIQAGVTNINLGGGGSTTGISMQTLAGQLHERFPRVRTWRSVR